MIQADKYSLKNLHKNLVRSLMARYPDHEKSNIVFLIIENVLNRDRVSILADSSLTVTKSQADYLNQIIKELNNNRPIQQIIGSAHFMGIELKVNEHTLIPRQETEELVDLIVKENRSEGLKILDIGTGSGCIAIALATLMNEPEVYALDNSREALKVAVDNSNINNLTVNFFYHDIVLDAGLDGSYDIIVSNPPYVLESEKAFIHENVLNYEPHSALFVKDDKALVYYESIIELSFRHLKPHGKLYFEINETKGNSVRKLLTECGFSDVKILQDLNGKDRFASACCRN